MSDQRLRELERRWRETGVASDEATLLRERVRVGDLDEDRLRLAAYCGSQGAIEALEGRALTPPLSDWPGQLSQWGEEVCLRALLGLLRPLLTSEATRQQVAIWVESGMVSTGDEASAVLTELVSAFEAYLKERTETNRQRLEAALDGAVIHQLNLLNWVWACSDAVRALGRGEDATSASCVAMAEITRQVERTLGSALARSAAQELGQWALR